MTIVFFKFSPKNKQIRHILSKIPKSGIFDPKFSHFCFSAKTLLLDKFQVGDFKCHNIVFKFQPKNIQIRPFWSQI